MRERGRGRNQEVNTRTARVQGKKQSNRMVELSESAIRREVNGEPLRVLYQPRAFPFPPFAPSSVVGLNLTRT